MKAAREKITDTLFSCMHLHATYLKRLFREGRAIRRYDKRFQKSYLNNTTTGWRNLVSHKGLKGALFRKEVTHRTYMFRMCIN